MKRILLLSLWLAVPAGLRAQAAEEYAFVVKIGTDTFAVENVTRLPGREDIDFAAAAVGRLRMGLTLGPAETVAAMSLEAWRPGSSDDGPPAQAGNITFRGDSVIAEFNIPAGTPVQRFPMQAGAIPYLNPSFAMIEQIGRRALALGGDSVAVPVLMIQGGSNVVVTVRRPGADSLLITFANTLFRAQIDAQGRLLSGAVRAQNLTFERVSGHVRPPAVQPPDYSAPAGAPYTAEEVRVSTPTGHVLAGTLTLPAVGGPFPAVLLVTGSGSQDRDEAIPFVAGYRPFRQLADTLSRRGIAVLRLDDRGFGESTGNAATATSADLADDARAVVAWLRARPDIDAARIGVVGHSEGGMIAPMLAASDTSVAAIVLIGGPAWRGRDIIAYQQRFAIEHSDAIRPEGRDSAAAAAQQQMQEQAARSPWLQYFLDYDPLATARRVKRTPVLILQGATDRQITAEQADELAAAFRAAGNQDVTVRVFPDVDHLMLHDPDGNAAGYASLPDRSVVPELRGALADWLVAHLR